MMLRRATIADADVVMAFLRARLATSMFPLANLTNHGFGRDHPLALRVWGVFGGAGPAGLIAITESGSVLPQAAPEAMPTLARVLDGERIAMILGDAAQVAALIPALGLSEAPMRLNRAEPLFDLALDALIVPDGPGTLHPIPGDAADLLADWRVAYEREAFGPGHPITHDDARRQVDGWRTTGSHRVLSVQGAPVAMTGFNARLPDAVQIGGVYTPPELRGRGHARRAVALHLAQARADGATRAILFAANAAAVRAYTAIGFVRIGTFTLCLFDGPQVGRV